MRSGVGEASANSAKQLLERIINHCRGPFIAKKEKLKLANRCRTLLGSLNNHSITPQHSNYDALESQLAIIEDWLAVWAKHNLLKRLLERGVLKASVTEFNDKLASIMSNFVKTQETTEPLSAMHETTQSLPFKSLNGEVTKRGTLPVANGVYCEVWEGRWLKGKGETHNKKVALKALRIITSQEEARQAVERLNRELAGWGDLRHRNILPFYGAVTDIGKRLYMVFPWRDDGNLLNYVKNNPQANKHHLLRGSAAGLNHLHSSNVIHGSVKCNNVLISPGGDPQICDFGIARVMGGVREGSVSKTVSNMSLVRHAAPELIKDNNSPTTPQSDTYSFAMLILECITEEAPFSHIAKEVEVISAKLKNRHPDRPAGGDERKSISDELWELMARCWSAELTERPAMGEVHSFYLNRA